MTKLRIVLADDHTLVREGLKLILNAQPDMEVVGEAGDGPGALQACLAARPDVAVLDLAMPGPSGAVTAARLRHACPGVRVLALTVLRNAGYLRQFLAAGATGYVLKSAAPADLARAIRTVAAGDVYLDPAVAGEVVNGVYCGPAGDGAADAGLTEKESEVARLVALGHTNGEIAARMDISVKTVEAHKKKMMEKLGLETRADVVRYAIHQGWLSAV
jgi:DNA-binding NarL/FixJ family response regulator